jgi:hypothetical protein
MLAIILAAFGLYEVKYEVDRVRAEIASVTQTLEQEHETLDVISAEWAYLSRPERLQKLAHKHLAVENLMVHQVSDLAVIPFPERMEASTTSQVPLIPASALAEGGR